MSENTSTLINLKSINCAVMIYYSIPLGYIAKLIATYSTLLIYENFIKKN